MRSEMREKSLVESHGGPGMEYIFITLSPRYSLLAGDVKQ